jgi:hypothetical protein
MRGGVGEVKMKKERTGKKGKRRVTCENNYLERAIVIENTKNDHTS